MRKPNVNNKYKLTYSDIKKLVILDRTKVCEPLFWRNNVVHAWCISESVYKSKQHRDLGISNSYWIGIYDEECSAKRKLKVSCSSHGDMCTYNFKKFFDINDIENELDLQIQERLLNKINYLIDNNILGIPE